MLAASAVIGFYARTITMHATLHTLALSLWPGLFIAFALAADPGSSDSNAVDPQPSAYIFSSFRGNGEDGLQLASSTDGYRWTPLNDNRSFLRPTVGGRLMRDPCKDERKNPLKKNLRYATADTPNGPFGPLSERFTGDWVEGPSAIRIKDDYLVYFDHYAAPHYYGAVRSKDLRTWEDCSKEMSFPPGHRHGTVFEATAAELEKLRAWQSPADRP